MVTLLLGVIVLVFILWGVGSFVNEPKVENVAEVNGEVISQREFELQYQRLADLYRTLFKRAFTPETLKGLNLKGTLLEELIQKRLLLQEARRLGLEASEEELMEAIARVPEFQVNGQFRKDRYLQALRLNRLTPGQFEVEQKQQLTLQKLSYLIQDSVHVSEAEVRERYRLDQERINLYFVRLSASDFLSKAEVTPGEVKGHYERNKEGLREPLKVQVEYLTYPFDYFSSKVSVSDKEIEDFYKRYRDTRFHQPKAVRLRHILLRFPPGADKKQKETIRLDAEVVLQQARGGKDFAQLAKEHSEDPSAAQGGDIGFFGQGQLLAPLDKVAFALKKGEIGDIVETSLGYHVLKVEETREGKTKSLKGAREEIVRALRAERGKSEAGKAADEDREKVVSGTDLSVLGRERGIPYRTSPFFSNSAQMPETDPTDEFSKAAFALSAKEISSPVEGGQAYYFLRLRQRKEPFIPSFAEVRSDLEKKLREAKAWELATQRANTLLGQLKKERDINKLSGEHGLVVEETGWFVRSTSQIPKIGVLAEVRLGGIPVSSQQPIADRLYTQKGAIYLLAFKESQEADMNRFDSEKDRLQEQLLVEKRQRAMQRFVESLKAKARIKVNAESLGES